MAGAPADGERAARGGDAIVALASGVGGGVLGAAHAHWQMAVESAQVLSGNVAYPADTPFYLYHIKLWTLSAQIPALFLALGFSERSVNLALNAGMGALSFIALALCCFALSRARWISIAVPFLVHAGGVSDIGVSYRILLLGSEHTFGLVATSYALLTLALAGLGRRRLAAFLLGVAPAVHPSVGAWCIAVAAVALLWEGGRVRAHLREWGPPFLLGALVTAVSFAHHLTLARLLPVVSPDVKSRILDAYLQQGDGHRNPSIDAPEIRGILIALETCLVGLLWLKRFSEDLTEDGRLLMRALTISAGMGLVCTGLMLVPAIVPDIVLVAMPWRNINITGLAFQAVFLGLMARNRERSWVQIALLAAVAALSLKPLFHRSEPFELLPLIPVALVIARSLPERLPGVTAMVARRLAAGLLALAVVWGAADAVASGGRRLEDWTSSPFFARVHEARGVVLTSSDVFHIQVRARRAVLLNGGNLNQLPYVLESGPSMVLVLREVYGVDLFAGRQPFSPWGLRPVAGKKLWESRTAEEWREVARKFAITDVVTYRGWRLRLPEVAADADYRLYHIPDGALSQPPPTAR